MQSKYDINTPDAMRTFPVDEDVIVSWMDLASASPQGQNSVMWILLGGEHFNLFVVIRWVVRLGQVWDVGLRWLICMARFHVR